MIKVGKSIYVFSKHIKIGDKLTDPFGREYAGFRVTFGSHIIPETKIIAEDDVIQAVFRQGKYK